MSLPGSLFFREYLPLLGYYHLFYCSVSFLHPQTSKFVESSDENRSQKRGRLDGFKFPDTDKIHYMQYNLLCFTVSVGNGVPSQTNLTPGDEIIKYYLNCLSRICRYYAASFNSSCVTHTLPVLSLSLR